VEKGEDAHAQVQGNHRKGGSELSTQASPVVGKKGGVDRKRNLGRKGGRGKALIPTRAPTLGKRKRKSDWDDWDLALQKKSTEGGRLGSS